jgi:hypothetical protein
MMARIGIRLALVVAIGATIACDRVTKHLAASMLAGTTGRSFLADTVDDSNCLQSQAVSG